MEAHLAPSSPKARPKPCISESTSGSLKFEYVPSPSEVESNLLILFHGLGDRIANFIQLAKQLQNTLPQTPVLVVCAPKRVPLLDEEAYMWWDSWDPLGELLANPNPSQFTDSFSKLLDHLTTAAADGGIGWRASNIHLFGFGQGGTAALEGAIAWARKRRNNDDDPKARIEEVRSDEASSDPRSPSVSSELGSIVSVSGPLLSHPTFKPQFSTPVLYFHRSPKESPPESTALKRGFSNVRLHRASSPKGAPPDTEAMPRGEEWGPIMRFWASLFRNRSSWELTGDLYSVKAKK